MVHSNLPGERVGARSFLSWLSRAPESYRNPDKSLSLQEQINDLFNPTSKPLKVRETAR